MERKNKREEVIINGKCYNFALGLVNDWLVSQGQWTPEGAKKLSDRLSQKIKKAVSNFLPKERMLTK